MAIETIGTAQGTLFRLQGEFGPAEARAVGDVLARAARGALYTIDFTRVRDFEDIAIGTLATSVMTSAATVALRGLALHQRRMLRYLGVDADRPPQAQPALG